jgi:hypothetical protein
MYGGEALAQVAFGGVSGAFFFDGIAETTTLTDSQASQVDFAGLNTESLAYSDQDVGQFNFVGTDANNYSVADNYAATATFATNLAETLTLTDAQAGAWGTYATQSENYTLTDQTTVNVAFAGTLAEVITFTEAISSAFTFYVNAAESLTLTNTQAGQLGFNVSIAESTVISEVLAANAIFNPVISEVIIYTDSQCAIGWFKINDDQDAKWGTLPIVIEEVADFGGFTFGGIDFAGSMRRTRDLAYPLGYSPTVVWTEVDDTESTNWTNINNDQQC